MLKNSYINKSKSNNWGTPIEFYNKLDKEFKFDFDPCPYKNTFDGLMIDWKKSNYVNPPYNNIELWAVKCRQEQMKGNLSVLLIPARTDTNYFHKYILPYAEIRFVKGRLKFISLDEKSKTISCAPFPSILCIYRPENVNIE